MPLPASFIAMLALSPGFATSGRNAADARLAELPRPVKRVVFLGDSITYSGQYATTVEAYFVTRYPRRHVEFVNVGLPSETVSGLTEPGHAGGQFPRPVLEERIGRVLEQLKPDLVFACYGMNDGIYLPFDPARFDAYRAGIEHVRTAVSAARSRIILLTPPFFDGLKTNNLPYQDVLDRYSQWLVGRRKDGWQVIDVHSAMTRDVAERRKMDPQFGYAEDGVHANDLGHWIIAKEVLQQLGARDIDNATSAEEMVAAAPHGKEILALVHDREETLKDAWLTQTGHKRPGMNRGVPIDEANSKGAEIEKKIRDLQRS